MAGGIFEIYLVESPDGMNYVGATSKTTRERWGGHNGTPRAWNPPECLGDAIAVYGKDRFVVTHIASAKNAFDAAALEEALIVQHGTVYPNGYNMRVRSGLHRFTTDNPRPVKSAKVERDWIFINPRQKVAWPPHAGRAA